MGYQLLWLEAVGFNLLLAALVTACSARLARRKWQILWPGLIALLLLFNTIACVAISAFFRQHGAVFAFQMYFPSMTLLSLVGAAWIIWRGLRLKAAEGEETEPAPAARSWPRGRLAVGTVIATGLSFMTFQDLDAAAKAELAALRVEAGALAVSVAPPGIPDAENAALFYEEAFEALPDAKLLPSGAEKLDQWLKRPEEHRDDPAFQEYLRRVEPALALFRLAAAKTGCRFDRNFAHPNVSMLLPEIQKMRQAAKLLGMNARIRAKRGDLKGAAEDIVAMRSMAGHMRTDPILISQLVAMALDDMANKSIEDWLAADEHRDAGPLQSVHRIGGASLRRDLLRAYRMEEATGLATFADLSSGTLDWWTLSGVQAKEAAFTGVLNREALGFWRVFFLRGELDAYLWHMNQVQLMATYAYRESRERIAKYDAGLEQDTPRGILVGLLVPALSRVAGSTARAEARIRLADLGVAFERFRLKQGRYPAKPEELAAENPALLFADPFDGQPLRMIQADGGVVLYSIGPDGQDDGGREFDQQAKTGDITFCLGGAYKARREKK